MVAGDGSINIIMVIGILRLRLHEALFVEDRLKRSKGIQSGFKRRTLNK